MLAFRLRLGLAVLSFSLVAFLLIYEKGFGQCTSKELSSVFGRRDPITGRGTVSDQVIYPQPSRPAARVNECSAMDGAGSATARTVLQDVVFHRWPREWVDAPSKFEDLGIFETHHGYRRHKLRYEIVPGFQSVAILYEPETIQGKAPAILNLNGHVGQFREGGRVQAKALHQFCKARNSGPQYGVVFDGLAID